MAKRALSDFNVNNSYEPRSKRPCVPWICIFCDFSNHQSLRSCKSCQSWKCDQCQIINPKYENSCTQCHKSQLIFTTNPLSTTTKHVSQWICTQCTLENDQNRTNCELCNNLKPSIHSPIPPPIPTIPTIPRHQNPNEWACFVCTFRNNANNTHCEVCANKRANNESIHEHKQNVSVVQSECDIDGNIMNLALTQLQRFGHKQFRASQYAVIQNLIKGQNTMLILPTGGGKSLCFQIPILVLNDLCNKQQKYGQIQKGIGIVISPLISLMNDQIHKLQSIGIAAEFINSSLRKSQRATIENRIKNNEIEMLYCAPELFTANSNKIIETLLKYRIITLFVIDEAHCISEWGHSFRPSYTKLNRIRNTLYDPVTMVCTATATKRVQADILKQLDLNTHQCKVHIASFDRPNIFIKCIRMHGKREDIEDIILKQVKLYQQERGTINDPVIIYCGTKNATAKTAKYLRDNLTNNKVAAYNGGMSDVDRNKVQNEFINGSINIITATNAFGMGIDKENVGLIIHKTSPPSIEEYYQQIGRAGRNGKSSLAVSITGGTDWLSAKYSHWLVETGNPKDFVIKKIANIICGNFALNERQTLSTTDILKKTGFQFNDNVTTATVAQCVKIFAKYGVLKKIKADLLPVTVTFLNGGNANMRQSTTHWILWNEISDRNRNMNNEIELFTFRLTQKLQITKTQLTKSLAWLSKKGLIRYTSLVRSGAIILLTKEWQNKIDWNEVERNRHNVVGNEERMKELINTNRCRRQLLLKYFGQNYVVGSNRHCCDNCNRRC